MKRIQFYPSKELESKLEEEALKLGISISSLVNEKLNEIYCTNAKSNLSLSELTTKVLGEVKAYINSPDAKPEFDILTASNTFANIEMTWTGKPSTLRAQIGKNFSKQIGKGDFSNIERAEHPNGKPKLSKNNASVYKITLLSH